MAQNGLRMWGGYLQKTCGFCLAPFLHKHHRQKYCSPRCAKDANRLWRLASKRHQALKRRGRLSFAANVQALQAELRDRQAMGFVLPGPVYAPRGVLWPLARRPPAAPARRMMAHA